MKYYMNRTNPKQRLKKSIDIINKSCLHKSYMYRKLNGKMHVEVTYKSIA